MDEFSITEAMVTYLRTEADRADDKAKRLRKQAAEIAERFGITEESQQTYDLDPNDLPPLDENGLPRYKGKKRGRKPKPRKRRRTRDTSNGNHGHHYDGNYNTNNSVRPKRKHTGYTLFMQETYPCAKSEHPGLPSKELIRLVAKQWKELETEGKSSWKERASNLEAVTAATGNTVGSQSENNDKETADGDKKDVGNDGQQEIQSGPHPNDDEGMNAVVGIEECDNGGNLGEEN